MTIFGTFSNVSIRNGTTESPAASVPAQYTSADICFSRSNWPAAGVPIEIIASFDGGTNYISVCGPMQIAAFVATAKQPTATDAKIGYGWSSSARPTHLKARALSTKAFTANVRIEAN
jgi:hypothetical protein